MQTINENTTCKEVDCRFHRQQKHLLMQILFAAEAVNKIIKRVTLVFQQCSQSF